MTILKVKDIGDGRISISYPEKPKERSEAIAKWLKRLSPGYVEYLLQFEVDPHCSACRDTDCENVGMGDDACGAFKFGEAW